jgi:hypothetical protein
VDKLSPDEIYAAAAYEPLVIPAKAGIHLLKRAAGGRETDSRLRGNDGVDLTADEDKSQRM